MSDGNNGEDTRRRVKRAEEVFDRYGDEIRAMIDFNVKDKSSAEDIFHDLFVSIVKKPVPLGIENVRAYLYRAVSNDVVDRFRRARNHREGIQGYAEYRRDRAGEKEPQNVAIEAEETERMLQLIESHLPPRQANAFIQQCGVRRGASDAAAELGIDRRSVSRYLTEAIKKMRRIVSNNEGVAG